MSQRYWACGLTTCAARVDTLLPRTLASLAAAGFDKPIIFADGIESLSIPGHTTVCRGKQPLKTVGNWVLGLWELLIRHPKAERFAMFQDDFVMCKGVRQYLDTVAWPERGYLNLYTFPLNQSVAKPGWFEAKECANGPLYHGKMGQKGLGAVALCFTRDAVIDLLANKRVIERPLDAVWPTAKLDGMIVTTMNDTGWREYCHDPSLVQHMGAQSSMGNRPHPSAISFKGEDWSVI